MSVRAKKKKKTTVKKRTVKKRKSPAKRKRKSPVKSPIKSSVLVRQEHGGALLSGGGGRRPGAGRPPSTIREHCRGSFAERVSILEAIADGKPLPTTKIVGKKMVTIQVSAAIKERTQAIDLLGKYGGVAELALTVEEQPEEVETPERAARFWAMLQQIKHVAAMEKLLVDHAKRQLGSGEN